VEGLGSAVGSGIQTPAAKTPSSRPTRDPPEAQGGLRLASLPAAIRTTDGSEVAVGGKANAAGIVRSLSFGHLFSADLVRTAGRPHSFCDRTDNTLIVGGRGSHVHCPCSPLIWVPHG
jgi:hypothetical protein